ncbi:ubiquinol-cytochrome c reductase iron-sulfur subunit [Hufsiella ginkgonis]|uniref:Rieske 2Fe-2S domain-containing protein n=1 Tax=Hufsiella ginkgonis TaxID=2695274 RepID=A0A7K1XYR2_9SPHI|nr:Rieske (2Fe-2S) protein [Hufsiella ginkgonis]MXV16093.1 Rieske 2Fe-2S domain-containing protein [Hufsiella ginkgonis]
MRRDEFLSTLGISLAAVCAGGCLAACGKSDSGEPGGEINPPSNVSFTVNLASQITAVGESLASNGVIVARIATGSTAASFTAVQQACTHEGTSILYTTSKTRFTCPNHGSEFSPSGSVLLGPATKSLKVYNIAIAGNMMTVTG